jgi:hypothetical protein
MDFFKLWEQAINVRPHLCFDMGYSSITDYCLSIYDKTGRSDGWGKAIISCQGIDLKIVQAEAMVKLAEYLNDKCQGY